MRCGRCHPKVDLSDGLRRRFLECPKGSRTLDNVSQRSFHTASLHSRAKAEGIVETESRHLDVDRLCLIWPNRKFGILEKRSLDVSR